MNRRDLVATGFAAIVGEPVTVAVAGPRDAFPTVAELEAGLSLRPGAQLPREVPTREGLFAARYVGARAHGGGRYVVEIQLEIARGR